VKYTQTLIQLHVIWSSSGLTLNDGLAQDWLKWLFDCGFLTTVSNRNWIRSLLFLRSSEYSDDVILRECWHGDWAVSQLAGYIALSNWLTYSQVVLCLTTSNDKVSAFIILSQRRCPVEIAGVNVFFSHLSSCDSHYMISPLLEMSDLIIYSYTMASRFNF